MIVVLINNISSAFAVLQSAYALSQSLKKQFGVIISPANKDKAEVQQALLQEILLEMNVRTDHSSVQPDALSRLNEICNSLEVSFLYIQLTNASFRTVSL